MATEQQENYGTPMITRLITFFYAPTLEHNVYKSRV